MNRTKTTNRSSALQITISITLIFVAVILGASAFKPPPNSSAPAAPAMSITATNQSVATLGDKTYSFSGSSNGVLTADSYKFDGTIRTPIASYPVPTESSSAVSDGTRYIYVMNGVSSGQIYQTTMYRYDPVANIYAKMASNAVGTRNQAAVYANGNIYKMGGENATGYQSALEIYNIATNTWSLGAFLPSVEAVGAAWVRDGFINTASYRYDVAANTWSPAVPMATWVSGDVFAGVASSSYRVYDNGGTFKETISNGAAGGFTTGCQFNPTLAFLYTTGFSGRTIVKYDDLGTHSSTFFSTGVKIPESIAFKADGGYFVGGPSSATILEYDSLDNFVTTHVVGGTDGTGGTDWIDLAANQTTLFYAAEGRLIRVWDTLTGQVVPDFATLPGSGQAFALRLLPPFDGTGGLLVADNNNVKRLNGSGIVIQTYSITGVSGFFALNLDPDGTSFWTGSFSNALLYRFDIATGGADNAIQTINNGTGPSTLFGVCLRGEITGAVPTPTPTPPPTPPPTPEPTATPAGTPHPHHVTPTPRPHVTPTPRPPHVTPTPHPPHATPTPMRPQG